MNHMPNDMHTPTPWRFGPIGTNQKIAISGFDSTHVATLSPIADGKGQLKANADLIVRAVNSHAALVSALEQARLSMIGNREYCQGRGLTHAGVDRCITMADAALALAKGAK